MANSSVQEDSSLVLATTTDSETVMDAVLTGNEKGSRVPAPSSTVEHTGVVRKSGGTSSSTVTVSEEHPKSERRMLLERLRQDQADLEADSLALPDPIKEASNENALAEPTTEQTQEPGQLDAEALKTIRETAIKDAIEEGRRRVAAQQGQSQSDPEAQYQEVRKAAMAAHSERMHKLRAVTPGYDELVASANVPIPEAAGDALMTLPGGDKALLHLMQHLDEAAQLQTMPEHLAIARIAQLAAKFDVPPAPRSVSKAAAPIKPVGGSSTKSSVPADDLPYQDYKKMREREIRAKRGR